MYAKNLNDTRFKTKGVISNKRSNLQI